MSDGLSLSNAAAVIITLTLLDSDDGCDVDTLLPPVLQDSFGIERRDLQQRIAELLSEREQSQQVLVVFRRHHHYHDAC